MTTVPSVYPFPDWQESGTYAVPADLRVAYSEAVTDPATIGRLMAEAESGKRGRYVWVPLQQADQMRDAGEVLPQVAEALSEDQRRVQVKVRMSGAEALHVARLRLARNVVEQRQRQAKSRAEMTDPCAACGVELVGTERAYPDPATVAAGILPAGTVLCRRCRVAIPAAVAAEMVPDGRTRAEALADLLWSGGDPTRGERDRQAVMARSARG